MSQPRQLATAAGNVMLTPTSAGEPTLRVPFSAVVRGISNISTTPRSVAVADQVAFTSTNDAGDYRNYGPFEVYAWGLSDPRGDSLATDLRTVGIRSLPEAGIGVFALHTANTVTRRSTSGTCCSTPKVMTPPTTPSSGSTLAQ